MDINIDLGEGFLFDEELMKQATSCNIACGGHTGTENSMRASVQLAIKNKVSIGAHPSYPDLDHFGRKEMDIPLHLLEISLEKQIHQLIRIAKEEGTAVRYIKPHGALYNKAANNIIIAQLIVDIVKTIEPSVALMGLANSELEKIAKKNYLMFIKEGFADRRYNNDGTLVNRQNSLALIDKKEEVWHQVEQMITEQTVDTIDHKKIDLKVDSICFHGDSPEALECLNYTTSQLIKNNIKIKNIV